MVRMLAGGEKKKRKKISLCQNLAAPFWPEIWELMEANVCMMVNV